jgi:hypothetical protein
LFTCAYIVWVISPPCPPHYRHLDLSTSLGILNFLCLPHTSPSLKSYYTVSILNSYTLNIFLPFSFHIKCIYPMFSFPRYFLQPKSHELII